MNWKEYVGIIQAALPKARILLPEDRHGSIARMFGDQGQITDNREEPFIKLIGNAKITESFAKHGRRSGPEQLDFYVPHFRLFNSRC